MAFKDFFAKLFGKKGAEMPMQTPSETVNEPQSEASTVPEMTQPMSSQAVGTPQSIEDVENMPEPKMPGQQ
jgi:hypothetical protein